MVLYCLLFMFSCFFVKLTYSRYYHTYWSISRFLGRKNMNAEVYNWLTCTHHLTGEEKSDHNLKSNFANYWRKMPVSGTKDNVYNFFCHYWFYMHISTQTVGACKVNIIYLSCVLLFFRYNKGQNDYQSLVTKQHMQKCKKRDWLLQVSMKKSRISGPENTPWLLSRSTYTRVRTVYWTVDCKFSC